MKECATQQEAVWKKGGRKESERIERKEEGRNWKELKELEKLKGLKE